MAVQMAKWRRRAASEIGGPRVRSHSRRLARLTCPPSRGRGSGLPASAEEVGARAATFGGVEGAYVGGFRGSEGDERTKEKGRDATSGVLFVGERLGRVAGETEGVLGVGGLVDRGEEVRTISRYVSYATDHPGEAGSAVVAYVDGGAVRSNPCSTIDQTTSGVVWEEGDDVTEIGREIGLQEFDRAAFAGAVLGVETGAGDDGGPLVGERFEEPGEGGVTGAEAVLEGVAIALRGSGAGTLAASWDGSGPLWGGPVRGYRRTGVPVKG